MITPNDAKALTDRIAHAAATGGAVTAGDHALRTGSNAKFAVANAAAEAAAAIYQSAGNPEFADFASALARDIRNRERVA